MTFFLSGRQRIGAQPLRVQHSPTVAALSTSFLLNHAPNSPIWTHWLQDLGSHIEQREYESWVKKTEEIKERLVDFWQHLNEKMRFSCFPVLPGSAEAHIIWGGKVKCFLIAHFMGNISAKKISKCVHVCQSYSEPKVGRFLRHSVACLYPISCIVRDVARYWSKIACFTYHICFSCPCWQHIFAREN